MASSRRSIDGILRHTHEMHQQLRDQFLQDGADAARPRSDSSSHFYLSASGAWEFRPHHPDPLPRRPTQSRRPPSSRPRSQRPKSEPPQQPSTPLTMSSPHFPTGDTATTARPNKIRKLNNDRWETSAEYTTGGMPVEKSGSTPAAEVADATHGNGTKGRRGGSGSDENWYVGLWKSLVRSR
ncbi:unnamed protein product [Zymoseptoria tritici ST99CH_3D1]|nr:unnamed protein product [Zymoseptoria tritici ST99CH_3D1]